MMHHSTVRTPVMASKLKKIERVCMVGRNEKFKVKLSSPIKW
jgi:hypothetical protein